MASPLNPDGTKPLFFDQHAGDVRRILVLCGIVYLATLLGILVWFTSSTHIGIFGLSAYPSIVVEWVLYSGFSALIGLLLYWKMYLRPRSIAYESASGSPSRVKVLAGKAQLVLAHPGETYVFLKYKRVVGATDENGGEQLIVPALGEEAMGPISMRTEMLPWTDRQVLTREAQPLEIALGVQWRVSDPQKYAFRIASEVHKDTGKLTADFAGKQTLASENTSIDPHRPAISWLYVWVEAAVRSYVSRLGMADIVVSAASLQWLEPSNEARPEGKIEDMAREVVEAVNRRGADYGIKLEGVSVQGIKLPQKFQEAIDRTREAFLAPIASQKEWEAKSIGMRGELEIWKELLGDDAFRVNQMLSNFKGANFGYFPFRGLVKNVAERASAVAAGGSTEALPQVAEGKVLGTESAPEN